MKINEIIKESATDRVSHYHKNYGTEIDRRFNPEAAALSKKNSEYYRNFKTSGDGTRVFIDTDNNPNGRQEPWSNLPDIEDKQSAGYRGRQNSMLRSGIKTDKPQAYDGRFRNRS